MKKTVEYKGYQASVEYDDGALFVKVLHIDDLLVAQVDAASDAQKALEDLIEAYLVDCAEEGRAATQPFKGSFNVRLGSDLHKRVAMRAADEGMTLNKWICTSIEEKLECGKLSERIDGVFSKSKDRIDRDAMLQWVSRQTEEMEEFHYKARRDFRVIGWSGGATDYDVAVPGALVALTAAHRGKMHG
ncbi:type II toxin-antitoxin system HicB family antitoxin [Rhizobium sp. YTU87027]|uniref:type II toxin-antitoxin system HicB family antitoxin n=1 Tax=Rhizobium sp. YTU87027 TaxID=3417741 RepID=UPI003D68F847